ncbi:rod shape-determining protein MreC [Intestinibacter sp.]
MSLKRDKNKRKINFKVIATGVVAITLIGIVGISIGSNSGSSPFNSNIILNASSTLENGVSKGVKFFTGGFSDILKFRSNAKKVTKLEEENTELQKQITELKGELEEASSLEQLKKALKFVDEKYVANQVAAKVVSKNDGLWYTSIVVSAGSDDGVKENSLVINGDGLVGIITEVSSNYSKAITLLDTTSSISFKLSRDSNCKGIITTGTGIKNEESNRDKGLLQGYMLDSDYDVLPGDSVVTSGLGLYPEDIVIGEVTKVTEDKSKSLKYVVVKPNVNFKSIDNVIIVEPRNIN